jgi:energy-coupling factor transport system ATP-binding protein
VGAVSIALEGVGYRYAGAATATLHEIHLTLEPGRVIGLVGRNGAGKSTLCLCAVGLAPNAIGGTLDGRITIDGLSTAETPMHRLAQHAGILFQESQTQITSGAPSVWEEIAFGPRNLSFPRDEVIQRTWAAIDALQLTEIIDRDPSRLSGGQAQLVALATVLALGPRYLVLDEPTSELDPLGTRLVGESLAAAARTTGVGVLIAEHKTDLLANLCDDIAVMDAGRIVAQGPTSKILKDPALREWGVTPPAQIALRQAATAAGIEWRAEWQ